MNRETLRILSGLDDVLYGERQPWRNRLAAFVAMPAALLLGLSIWIKGDGQ